MIICSCAHIPMYLILLSLIKQMCSHMKVATHTEVATHMKGLNYHCMSTCLTLESSKSLPFHYEIITNMSALKKKLYLCEESKNCRYTCPTNCLLLPFLGKTSREELLPMTQIPSHYSSTSKEHFETAVKIYMSCIKVV